MIDWLHCTTEKQIHINAALGVCKRFFQVRQLCVHLKIKQIFGNLDLPNLSAAEQGMVDPGIVEEPNPAGSWSQ
jgi:hypothetical protein